MARIDANAIVRSKKMSFLEKGDVSSKAIEYFLSKTNNMTRKISSDYNFNTQHFKQTLCVDIANQIK